MIEEKASDNSHSGCQSNSHGISVKLVIMQVSISSITIPPRTPRDLHQKFAPTLGLLHPSFCPGGAFVGAAPEGGHLSKAIFAIFAIFIMMARIGH